MGTLEDGIEAMQQAVEVFQAILNEETLEYFTEQYTQTTERAARRILEIGPLLYSRPLDALHISLWETLAAMDPKTQNNEAYTQSLFRGGTWALTKAVTRETTWDELEVAVMREVADHRATSDELGVVHIR